MENEKKSPFMVWLDAETAIAPIDDVLAVLQHAYVDFNLGNLSLNEAERFDLLNQYQTLGSLIMVAIDVLYKVRDDFAKCRPPKEEAQTQSNPESTT